MSDPIHPGLVIRNQVIPRKMSVTKAAKLLGVGRQALSNLINGNTSLSADMASRFERVFDVKKQYLLDQQSIYQGAISDGEFVLTTTSNYVKPLYNIKAKEIETWGAVEHNRYRLPNLVRNLIHTTGKGLGEVQFLCDDLAEVRGWDGEVVSEEATNWIPKGKSGWELSTTAMDNIRDKATCDYKKRTRLINEAIRKETSFVFVTTHVFPEKQKWIEERKEQDLWKDIRIYDVDELVAWIEQSVPSQVWFANFSKRSDQFVRSLEFCWLNWIDTIDKRIFLSLFESLAKVNAEKFKHEFDSMFSLNHFGKPLVVTGDSKEEVLAYLYHQFSNGDVKLRICAEKAVVFEEIDGLSSSDIQKVDCIPIVTSDKVERDFKNLNYQNPWIRVDFRGRRKNFEGIELRPLDSVTFKEALRKNKKDQDAIQELFQKSGRSLTVLRRELSNKPEVQCPKWAIDRMFAKQLIPFSFAGVWDGRNSADRIVLERLSEKLSYEDIEMNVSQLAKLEGSPIWTAGRIHGVVSKVDALFSLARASEQDEMSRIEKKDFNRFIDVFGGVFGDEADFPERLEEGLQGTKQQYSHLECSTELRNGLLEVLLLFSVYGNRILSDISPKEREECIDGLIRRILSPLKNRHFHLMPTFLPILAEIAPDVFLQVIRNDIECRSSICKEFVDKSKGGLFESHSDQELMWALEGLAWFPKYFEDVCVILVELAKTKVNKFLYNAPLETLQSLFRCWMPQTSVAIERRIEVMENLFSLCDFDDVLWNICINQINGTQNTASYNHKPFWRSLGANAGEPVSSKESSKFAQYCYGKAITWRNINKEKVVDLVSCVMDYSRKYQDKIWDCVESWASTANEVDKSEVREAIRSNAFTLSAQERARQESRGKNHFIRAKKVFMSLETFNVVTKHKWLFNDSRVDESLYEHKDIEEYDFDVFANKLQGLREDAILEILNEQGFAGIIDILKQDTCGYHIGKIFAVMDITKELLASYINEVLRIDPNLEQFQMSSFVRGVLQQSKDEECSNFLKYLIKKVCRNCIVPILVNAPFGMVTWDMFDQIEPSQVDQYWNEVESINYKLAPGEVIVAVQNFLRVKRPRTAFKQVKYDYSAISGRDLYEVLEEMVVHETEEGINDTMYIQELRLAFRTLNQSKEFSEQEMAELEMSYILQLDNGNDIPNLSRTIQSKPVFFGQAVAFAYPREDDGDEPDIFTQTNNEKQVNQTKASQRLLSLVNKVPFFDGDKGLESRKLLEWIKRVRSIGRELGRPKFTERAVGTLISKVKVGKDGMWPVELMRDLLEEVLSDEMMDSICIDLYNSTEADATLYGEGTPRRILSEKHSKYAEKLRLINYGRLGDVHSSLAQMYERDAKYRDDQAEAFQRTL